MKKLISVMFIALSITFVLSSVVHAQAEVSWDNPSEVFEAFPEIVAEVFTDFNIPNNSSGGLPMYENADGRNCAPAGMAEYYFQNGEGVWFINGYDEELEIAQSSSVLGDWDGVILDQRQIVYRNLSLNIFVVNIPPYTPIEQFGTVELVPGSGEYFGFRVTESCISAFGAQMPDVESLVKDLVDKVYLYGYGATETQSGDGSQPEEEPVYEYPLEEETEGEDPGAFTAEEYDELTNQEDQQRIPPEGFAATMTGAAVAGAVAGTAVVTLASSALITLGGLGKPGAGKVVPPKEPVYYSLATGKPAPLEQVQQEQQMVNSGYAYRDGQWYAPSGEYRAGPSILSTEYQQEKKQRQADRQQQWAQQDAQAKKDNIKFDMEINEGLSRQHMVDVKQKGYQIMGLKAVEWAADASIAAASRFVPGGGGYVFKKWYERIKMTARAISTGVAEGSTAAALESVAKEVAFNKISKKVPTFVPKPTRAAYLAKHGTQVYRGVSSAGRSLQNSAVSEGMDMSYENGKKKIIKWISGR